MKDSLKKTRFHDAEKLLSLSGISKKTRRKRFPTVGERFLLKSGFSLIWTMVSTSTKDALNKRTLDRKSVSTRRNATFDKKSVSTSQKNCFLRWELKKSKNISFYLFPRMVPTSRKKALNENRRFVIYRKSVSTNQNEGFVEKYGFTGPKNCSHSNQCPKKLKKMASTNKNKISLNIGFFPIAITVLKQKNLNGKISIPLTENPLPLGALKDSFKTYFHEMEKLLPMERLFKKLEQNGFH